jgi:hypothetical protein
MKQVFTLQGKMSMVEPTALGQHLLICLFKGRFLNGLAALTEKVSGPVASSSRLLRD